MPDETPTPPAPTPASTPTAGTRPALPGSAHAEKHRPMRQGERTKHGGLLIAVTPC